MLGVVTAMVSFNYQLWDHLAMVSIKDCLRYSLMWEDRLEVGGSVPGLGLGAVEEWGDQVCPIAPLPLAVSVSSRVRSLELCNDEL